MLAKFIAVFSVFVALLFPVANADSAEPPQAEILHWWSTDGEFSALKVFIEEFEARGGQYYNTSKKDHPSNRQEAIERMAKGYPATLTQWNAGNDLVEMFDFGLIHAVSDADIVQRLKDTLPAAVLDVVTHKGQIIAVPLNVHTENWLWYNKKYFSQAESDPTTNWSEFLKWGDELADEGIPLLAVSDQPWQVRILFTSVFLGISRTHYTELFLAGNADVIDSEEFKTTLDIFSQLARYSQSFGDGAWDAQVKAVVKNKAAANVMGDWAKSAFIELGQRAGVDYGCRLTGSGDPSLLMAVDTLVLGKVREQSELDGQKLMLDIVLDPALNLQFNTLKGSLSPYAQPTSEESDPCSAQAYAVLSSNGELIPPVKSYFSEASDYMEDFNMAMYELWTASQQPSSNLDELVKQARDNAHTIMKQRADGLLERAQTD